MQLDKHHRKIIQVLGTIPTTSYTQLRKKAGMNARTFRTKIYELVRWGFVERDPPSSEPIPHGGKRVTFRLTVKGIHRFEMRETLDQFETNYQGHLEEIIKNSVEMGKGPALAHSTMYLISRKLPIFTITHLPSRQQYEKLIKQMNNDMVRKELGRLINQTVEYYTEEKTDELSHQSVTPLQYKEKINFMGYLGNFLKSEIEEAIDENQFKDNNEALKFIMSYGSAIFTSARKKLKRKQGPVMVTLTTIKYDENKDEYVKASKEVKEVISKMPAEAVKAMILERIN